MRTLPADFPLRVVRLLLAVWLIVSPFLLGYGWTFAQRQDTVAGILLLPLLVLGLVVPGMRVALLVVGPWLIFSPYFSGWYAPEMDAAIWNARITGLLATILGLVAIPDRPLVMDPQAPEDGDRRFEVAPRPGWTGLWRRRLPAR